MSEPFTVEATGFWFQTLERIEEVRLAYSERYFAVNGRFRKYVWTPAHDVAFPDEYGWVTPSGGYSQYVVVVPAHTDHIEGKYEWVDGNGTADDTMMANVLKGVEFDTSLNKLVACDDQTKTAGINLQAVPFYREIQEFIALGYKRFAKAGVSESPLFDTPEQFFEYVGCGLYKAEGTTEDVKVPYGFGFRRASEVYAEESDKAAGRYMKPKIERCVYTSDELPGETVWYVSGLIEAGDILGSWIVDDLLDCLSAIRAIKIPYRPNLIEDEGGVNILCPSWAIDATINTGADSQRFLMLDDSGNPTGEDEAYAAWVQWILDNGIYPLPPSPFRGTHFGWWPPTESSPMYITGTERPSTSVWADDGHNTRRCSYSYMEKLLTMPGELTAPRVGYVSFFKQIFINATNAFEGPITKVGNLIIGGEVALSPKYLMSRADPYFIADWNFTNIGRPA